MQRKCPVYAPYMQKMPRICSVYGKNAPYMLRIWKKCPVYARICSVYAPYMLRIFLSITQWKKRIEPEPKKMHLMLACSLRCSSIPKRWGQRTSKFPHVCFEAVTTAIHYLLSWKAFQKDACEIKIAHFLFAQPQPKTFRLRLPQKFPHISIEAVTTAIYVVCCHEKISKVCFWSKDCTFSYEAFTSATCGIFCHGKFFKGLLVKKNDPFSFDTLYIQTYPGHRNEVRDIRASNWQWASTSSCTMGGFSDGGGDGDPAGPWGGGDGGGDEVETETETEVEVMEMKMIWILLLGGLSKPDLAEKNGPAGKTDGGTKGGRENRALLWKQAVPIPWPLSQLVLAPGKLELKRWGKTSGCLVIPVGPFFLKNGKKQTIFMNDFLKEISVYHFSHYVLRFQPYTETANNLKFYVTIPFLWAIQMQVTRVEREQSLYICLLDPCHFFLKRFQPLYLDSGNIFISYMSIYSFFRYKICK